MYSRKHTDHDPCTFAMDTFLDASYAPSIDAKLIVGNIIFVIEDAANWATKKKKSTIARSLGAAEMIALVQAEGNTIGVEALPRSFELPIVRAVVYKDNEAAIANVYRQDTFHREYHRQIDEAISKVEVYGAEEGVVWSVADRSERGDSGHRNLTLGRRLPRNAIQSRFQGDVGLK